MLLTSILFAFDGSPESTVAVARHLPDRGARQPFVWMLYRILVIQIRSQGEGLGKWLWAWARPYRSRYDIAE